jgi:hypothetical protein
MIRAISRIRQLMIAALALAVLICMFPGNANADSIVTVEGVTYDITTITTTFSSASATLETTPWWGSQIVADEFAGQVGTALGLPNNIGLGLWGPFFAWTNTLASPPGSFNAEFYDTAYLGIADTEQDPNTTFTFAVASVVATPEPGTFSMLLGGLLGLGLLVYFRR